MSPTLRAQAPTSELGVRSRFLLLTGLRWLPIGFLTPVFVLLPMSRGLSLPETGIMFATYGATTALLELPTGGVADAVGRRLTLVLSSLLHLVFFALLLVADGLSMWMAAAFVGGVARALDSGPLEAWYVDESRRIEPGVTLRPGLSAAGVVEGLGLALSALAGGLLPALIGEGLLVVVWAAIAGQSVHLLALLMLLREHRPTSGGASDWRAGVRAVPIVMSSGLGQAARSRPVRMLLIGTLVWGVALAGIEVLWQPHFVALLGGEPDTAASEHATVLLGALMAAGFLLAALGSFLTPWFARLFAGQASRGALAATLMHGGACLALAAAGAVVPAAVAFVAFYFVNGLRGPLHNELLHEHVSSERRSTMLSVESLSLQAGGFACALLLPTIAAATGIPWAWAGVAGLLAVSALLYLAVPDVPDVPDGEHPAVAGEAAPPTSAGREPAAGLAPTVP